MSILLHQFAGRFRRDFREITGRKRLNAGTVVLHWDGAAAPVDPNVEGDYPAAIANTETITGALIHWVSMRALERGPTIYKAGDAIVTFDADVTLTGRTNLYFVLPDGKSYVQAVAGRAVVELWEVHVGGVPLTNTMLLRLRQ